MQFEDILAVLHGWLDIELEIGTHGANGAQPVSALEARGRLQKGEELRAHSATSGSFLFTLVDADGTDIAGFRLYEDSYAGGGWFDDDEEVLEVRSGVIQLLIAPVADP